MAITQTALLRAITAGQVQNLPLVSAVNFNPGQPVKIDGEYMVCTTVNAVANTINVRGRGSEGTPASAHDVNAAVMTSVLGAVDFPTIAPGANSLQPVNTDDIVTIGATPEIVSVPLRNTTYLITCASAAAITIAPGTPAQAGITMTFLSATAFAHTVTYAPGFTSPTGTLATFTAKVGSSLLVETANSGLLAAIGLNNVVLSL